MNIADKIRQDFPLLNQQNNNLPLVYLDNACQSLRPQSVIDALNDYYLNFPVCAGRSNYRLAKKVTEKIEESRKMIADFIGATSAEIIFTRNATEGINLLANSLNLQEGDIVLTTDKEHNSNLVPWQVLVKSKKIKHEVLLSENNEFSLIKFEDFLKNNSVRLVAMVATSNLDGTSLPLKEIIDLSHKYQAEVLFDGAQLLMHQKVDVAKLNLDYLVFSGHKLLGPSGVGALYVKAELMEKLNSFMVGGDTVEWTTYEDHKFLTGNQRFEAGLQDFAGIIGFGTAIKYLQQFSITEINEQISNLNKLVTENLLTYEKVKIIGPDDYLKRGAIINFYVEGVDVHQLSIMLDETANVMVRSGQHCVHSWFNANKIKNSLRVSLSLYNNEEDVRIFNETFNKIMKLYS